MSVQERYQQYFPDITLQQLGHAHSTMCLNSSCFCCYTLSVIVAG